MTPIIVALLTVGMPIDVMSSVRDFISFFSDFVRLNCVCFELECAGMYTLAAEIEKRVRAHT